MKTAINFVRGAVAKNDAIPILTHLHVHDGRVQASNGRVCIDTPCKDFLGFNFTSPLKKFLLAIDNCDDEPELTVKGDTLTVRSGSFKTSFPMLPEEYPVTAIEYDRIIKPEISIIPVLKTLVPFIGDDSNRPWSNGIYFNKDKAYATNSIVMIQADITDIGVLNIPGDTARELIRIGREPVGIYSTENHLIFLYDDDSWVRSNNLSTEWPDVSKYIPQTVNGTEITADFIRDVERVGKFSTDTKIHFSNYGIKTTNDECVISGYDLHTGIYRNDIINAVLQVADCVDFSTYPSPCPFIADTCRGVMIGMRG